MVIEGIEVFEKYKAIAQEMKVEIPDYRIRWFLSYFGDDEDCYRGYLEQRAKWPQPIQSLGMTLEQYLAELEVI